MINPSEALSRAGINDIPTGKRWQISGAWEVELDRVTNWLRRIANENLGRLGGNSAAALDAGRGLPDEIVARFGADEAAVSPTLMDKASLGLLESSAPSSRSLKLLMVLKWLAFFSELMLFVLLWFLGFGSGVVIVIGALLALSGFLMGFGAGNLLIGYEEGTSARHLWAWTSMIGGAVSTVLLAWLRASGDEEIGLAALIFPVALALVIALLEALEVLGGNRFRRLRESMFRAQTWFASARHREKFNEGLWWRIYEGEVSALSRNLVKAYQGDVEVEGIKR